MNVLDKFILGFIAMYMLLEVISIWKYLKMSRQDPSNKYRGEIKTKVDMVLDRIEFEYTYNWSSRGNEKYVTVDRLEEIVKESRREIDDIK